MCANAPTDTAKKRMLDRVGLPGLPEVVGRGSGGGGYWTRWCEPLTLEVVIMTEKSLYERLGGVFAIAAVVDHFSDAVVKNPIVGKTSKNPGPQGVAHEEAWAGCRASSSCEPCGFAPSRAGRSNTRPQDRERLRWVLRRRIVTSGSRQTNSTRSRPSLGAPLTSSKCLGARRKKSSPPSQLIRTR